MYAIIVLIIIVLIWKYDLWVVSCKQVPHKAEEMIKPDEFQACAECPNASPCPQHPHFNDDGPFYPHNNYKDNSLPMGDLDPDYISSRERMGACTSARRSRVGAHVSTPSEQLGQVADDVPHELLGVNGYIYKDYPPPMLIRKF